MRFTTTALLFIFALLCVTLAHGQNVQVQGALAREYALDRGQSASDTITLTNLADEPVQVRIYQTDYSYRLDQTRYDDPGTLARSNAAWISCTPTIVALAARQTADVMVKIQVPQDAKLAGSYWSMLMVEPQSAPPQLTADKDKAVLGIQTVVRYGIQMLTTIGDSGTAEVKFMDKQVVTEDGKRTLAVDLENSGTRALRPMVWAEFYDAGGALVKRVESSKARLYPGCAGRYKLDVSALQPGKYQVLAVADNGDDNVFGARYSLDLQ